MSSNILESRATQKALERIKKKKKKNGPESLEILITDGDHKTFQSMQEGEKAV